MIELTPEEARIVAGLIRLYDQAVESAAHPHKCECSFCAALEAAGECQTRDFRTLENKVKL